MGAELVLEGMEQLLANLEEYKHRKLVRAQSAVKLMGNAYKNDVQDLAPVGHPRGGTYRRSIHVQPATNDDIRPYVLVGTNLPQGPRLEFGFFDMTDRLGRHFYQLPQPHFRPPLDTEWEKYVRIAKGELVDEKYGWQSGMNWGVTNDAILSTISTTTGNVRPDLVSGAMS